MIALKNLPLLKGGIFPYFRIGHTRTGGIGAEIKKSVIGYWKLNEASGPRLDSGPNGLDWTDVNTVGSRAGQVGLAADFVAANIEYFDHADDDLFSVTGDRTWTGIFEEDATGTSYGVISKWNTGVREWNINITSTDKLRAFFSTDGTNAFLVDDPTSLAAGTPYFWVVQWDNTTHTGTIQFTALSAESRNQAFTSVVVGAALASSTHQARIGVYNGTQARFDGAQEELGFFNKKLTAEELDYLFDRYKAGKSLY